MTEKQIYNKPKLEKIENIDYLEEFKELGFDLEKLPEINQRVKELADMPCSHFEDSVKMAQIVRFMGLQGSELLNFDSEDLQLACLFHDIGKTGPVNANERQRFLLGQIFNTIYFQAGSQEFQTTFKERTYEEARETLRKSSIKDMLEVQGFPNNDEIVAYLSTLEIVVSDSATGRVKIDSKSGKVLKEKLDVKKHTMIDLWNQHDYWTYDILTQYNQGKIDDKIIKIASTHHFFEGHNPAGIKKSEIEEITAAGALELVDKYLILTLVDKYQAYLEREKISHQEAIKRLKSYIGYLKKTKKDDEMFSPEIFEKLYQYIDLLDKLKDNEDFKEFIGNFINNH